jgi:hypothetical protein
MTLQTKVLPALRAQPASSKQTHSTPVYPNMHGQARTKNRCEHTTNFPDGILFANQNPIAMILEVLQFNL